MALKMLVMKSRCDKLKKTLEELRKKDADFDKREKELETAVGEMNEETPEEDRKLVEDKVDELEKEKGDHEAEKKKLEEQIKELEKEMEEEEKRSAAGGAGSEHRNPDHTGADRRGKETAMANTTKFFGMSIQERDAFVAREDMKNFLSEVRTCIKERRALTNVGLTIPEVALPLIKQVASETSKLMKHVTIRNVSGTTRQNIMGEIPEAFWDEMCAALKEMDLAFYNMEADGFKVSGYFAVCNAILEDSDLNLAEELFNAIGKAIGKAIDKAILYGKGVKMPMGIVTSLTTVDAPAGYPTTGREWEDLSASHVITGEETGGTALFQEIVKKSGIIDNDYETGAIVWAMNRTTHTKLIAESMGVNSAAAIVAGMNNVMPVIGGTIEEFKYIPDDVIIFGYFKNYMLVERAGTKLAQSEHVKFIEDQTVFKGTARYDGKPVIREAFAVFGIGNAPSTAAPKFAGEA